MLESEVEAAGRHLEQVLESSLFARSKQLSRLLRFLIEQHLEGNDQELKESVIGVEVFGRKAEYNPRFDPIVRTEARRLRLRLSQYYADEGKGSALIIELPKGGYVPVLKSVLPARVEGQVAKPSIGRLWPGIALVSVAVSLTAIAWFQFGWTGQKGSQRSVRARDLYVRGRAFETMPRGLSGVEESISLFEQAIAVDHSFAPAYAGVAAGQAARSAFDRFAAAERARMISAGWDAVKKAIRLDPRLADAHDALAMMQAREGQWIEAEQSFRRAVESAPREALWRNHYSLFLLLPLGRIDEALIQLRVAEALDPHSFQTHSILSLALRAAGRFEEAEMHCHMAAQNDREQGVCWAYALIRQGKTAEAVRILETVWKGHMLENGAQALAVAYARAGRNDDAERIAALLPRPANKAQIFAALGDKERTLEALSDMVPMGPTRFGRDVLISPEFAFLRGDPRLAALRDKVGLRE